ncbi:MAG: hypothetical protein V5B30_00780 [Candidatus Accumulibacter delftensis]
MTSCTHFRFLPWLLAAGVALLALTAHAAPRKPSDDSEVLERLPTRAGDASARELVALRAAMAAAARIHCRQRGSPSAISSWPWRVAIRATPAMPKQ